MTDKHQPATSEAASPHSESASLVTTARLELFSLHVTIPRVSAHEQKFFPGITLVCEAWAKAPWQAAEIALFHFWALDEAAELFTLRALPAKDEGSGPRHTHVRLFPVEYLFHFVHNVLHSEWQTERAWAGRCSTNAVLGLTVKTTSIRSDSPARGNPNARIAIADYYDALCEAHRTWPDLKSQFNSEWGITPSIALK